MKANWLRFTLLTALFSIIPSLLMGGGTMPFSSIVLFWLLTLLVPVMLLRQRSLTHLIAVSFARWQYIYCWFIWNFLLYMGSGSINLIISKQDRITIALVWLVACTVEIIAITATAVLLSYLYQKRDPAAYLKSVWNMGLLSLPIPMIMLGNLLFIDVRNPLIMAQISPTALWFSVQLVCYVLIVVTMAVISFYLYPRDHERKLPRIVAILVTALVWLAINGHALFGYIPPVLLPILVRVFPTFQGNALIYVTPALFEWVVLGISYGFGYIVEQYWIQQKKKNA